MSEVINSKILYARFADVKFNYLKSDYKYIHVRTVENFIFHFDSFFLITQKQEIADRLYSYFDTIDSSQVDNVSKSVDIYNRHLRPLTVIYAGQRGFHMVVKYWIFIVWTLPILIGFYFLHLPIYFYAGLFLIIAIFILRQIYFSNRKIAYGFMH